MSYRFLFIVNAFVALLFGVVLMVFPSLLLDQFGVDEYAATKLASQFFGTAALTLGLVLWFAKDTDDASVQRNLGLALLVGSVMGFIVTVIGTATGAMRLNGWIPMVVYILFGLGYAFMLFLQPRMNSLSPQSPPSAR